MLVFYANNRLYYILSLCRRGVPVFFVMRQHFGRKLPLVVIAGIAHRFVAGVKRNIVRIEGVQARMHGFDQRVCQCLVNLIVILGADQSARGSKGVKFIVHFSLAS